jgi:maltose alpha-D-glucosyltransferase/alpha-amylase
MLLGTAEFAEGNQHSAVATVHTLIQNQGDGWTVTAAYLDRFVDDLRLLAVDGNKGESDEEAPYLRIMAQAGRRIAQLHMALAGNAELAAFAPEPVTGEDVRRWAGEAIARADRLLDALAQRDAVREADKPFVDRLLAQRDALHHRLGALLPTDLGGLNIRVHGDFRLEQMLIVKDDIFIIGFEGDLGMPLAERRRKTPAARDIAAMLRSIDYSVNAALDRALKVAPDEQGRLVAALTQWRDHASDAFLTGYRETMTNARLWPADLHATEAMVKFFSLEKAVREIEYELAQRPEWLRLPLVGLLRLLES